MLCYYQCINGQGVLFEDDCPLENCPVDGGPCSGELIFTKPCPRP